MKVLKKHISLIVTRICTILVMLGCVQTYANVFCKTHEIWGFPPSLDRYDLTDAEINKVEYILKKNIGQYGTQFRFRKKMYKKYIRQYVGYKKGSYWVKQG